MNKQDLLSTLAAYIKSGTVSRDEVIAICNIGIPITSHTNPESQLFEGKKSFSATNLLYLVGSLVILIGIGTLLFRFWDDLSSAVRIALTLGIAVAAYISGILLRTDEKAFGIGAVMQGLGGILAPLGIFITIHEIGIQHIGIGWIALVAILLAVIYILSLLLFRSIIFSLFSIIFTTWAVYSSVAYVLTQTTTVLTSDIYKYLTLAMGAGYLFLASYIKNTSHRALRGILDIFGMMGIFVAILVLSGYKPTQSVIWELVGVIAIIGGLYISSVAQNRTILKTTAFFIFVFIAKFTGEYFTDSFGWPIALILGGFILIGVGYGLVVFNKRITVEK